MTPTQAGSTLALLFTLGAGAALLGSAQADSPTPPADAKQPTSKAGKVRWNQDLSAARQQAAQADQPLLVFQLLGDLDQEFC